MRYIAEYYPIELSELKTGQTIADLKAANEDCKRYEQAVIDAVKSAYTQFILPHSNKKLLYSRTWGK